MADNTTITTKRYPRVAPEEAEAHSWVFTDKDNFELYACNFPEMLPTEIRAKVLYTGLCQSDSHHGRSEWGPAVYPCCPGHEVVAKITHVGSEVTERKVGDVIGVGPFRNACLECNVCKAGDTQCCTEMGMDERLLYTYYFGGYSTLIQVPWHHSIRIPEGMDFANIPPLMCAGITTYAPLVKNCKAGDKVAILGIGGLGHLAVQIANKMGCEVTAFTTTESKVEYIQKLGAKNVIVVDKEFEALKQVSRTFDALLNTLPCSDRKMMDSYLSTIRPNGKLLQVGLPPSNTAMEFSFGSIIGNQISVVGSVVGSTPQSEEMLEFCKEHGVRVEVEDFEFEDFPKALHRLEKERPKFRCVVDVKSYAEKHENL